MNFSSQGISQTSDFSGTTSVSQNPTVGWNSPGLKTVTLEVTDDDGNVSSTSVMVRVLNQVIL